VLTFVFVLDFLRGYFKRCSPTVAATAVTGIISLRTTGLDDVRYQLKGIWLCNSDINWVTNGGGYWLVT
jgi:hypothetical protein